MAGRTFPDILNLKPNLLPFKTKDMKILIPINLLGVIFFACPDCGFTQPKQRPNIILIMADDMGYEALGCNGSAYKTPHLDRLAKTGARFTHCYSTPLCTPSRVLIMTGRYGFRNYSRFGILDSKERTFGHMMQAAGYATVLVGKWQLGSFRGAGTNPERAGFDEYIVWNYRGEPGKTGDRYANPKLIALDPNTKKEKLVHEPKGYGPDFCVNYLLDFVERKSKKNQPFFAWYPMILTHSPFVPTPHSKARANPKARHKGNGKYFRDMVEYTDHLVGRIVAKLEELKIRDNTLIIFTCDNGTSESVVTLMADGSRIRGGKGYARDTGVHVPLIVNWPGMVKPKQVTDQLVDFSDFLPTLAQAANCSLPKAAGDGKFDGISFLPAISKSFKGPLRKWVYTYYVEKRQNGFGWPRSIFVRDQQHKLYGFYEKTKRRSNQVVSVKTGQMFDSERDPNELKPITDEKLAAKRKRFQAILDKLGAIPKSAADSGLKDKKLSARLMIPTPSESPPLFPQVPHP